MMSLQSFVIIKHDDPLRLSAKHFHLPIALHLDACEFNPGDLAGSDRLVSKRWGIRIRWGLQGHFQSHKEDQGHCE